VIFAVGSDSLDKESICIYISSAAVTWCLLQMVLFATSLLAQQVFVFNGNNSVIVSLICVFICTVIFSVSKGL
jgi:hypothetical protein